MTVDEFLAPHTPEVRALAEQTRTLVKSAMPGAVETVRPGRNSITYDMGGGMADWICYIAPFKSYINLGFFRGTELPDPQGLLEGTGKLLRHVKIRTSDDVQRPSLRDLIAAAAAACHVK